ncbi:unnamed protein product [Hymenolepis diminuta]|uniref:Uncharacterized protein n=1 Tax=Hymenolepis diminuta TaxID=6216 RepID=A0A564Z2K0_HYMDI|nr:unnamed protein product [Hymenolepis diminuta]
MFSCGLTQVTLCFFPSKPKTPLLVTSFYASLSSPLFLSTLSLSLLLASILVAAFLNTF